MAQNHLRCKGIIDEIKKDGLEQGDGATAEFGTTITSRAFGGSFLERDSPGPDHRRVMPVRGTSFSK